MNIESLYIQKNAKKVEGDRLPDIRISGITEGGEFVDIGGLWKTKSGKGYSGKIKSGTLTFEKNEVVQNESATPEIDDVIGF